MAPRLRRMKTYRPRRRRKAIEIQKQELSNLKHKISTDIGTLIVLIEQGDQTQASQAKLKAKSDFLKYSGEMHKIAQKMGERFAIAVREYLDSVDRIVHSETAWIDDAKIRHCYETMERLEKEFSAA